MSPAEIITVASLFLVTSAKLFASLAMPYSPFVSSNAPWKSFIVKIVSFSTTLLVSVVWQPAITIPKTNNIIMHDNLFNNFIWFYLYYIVNYIKKA